MNHYKLQRQCIIEIVKRKANKIFCNVVEHEP